MCFAVSINVLPWSLMFSSNYKCFAVADMGHRTFEYKEYFTSLTGGEFRRVQEIFKFFSIRNTECLAKR